VSQDVTQTVKPAEAVDAGHLEAVMARLAQLEEGFRQELAAQVARAVRAEVALSAAQARAETDSIRARTESGTATTQSTLLAEPGEEHLLAAARREAMAIVAEARREAEVIRAEPGPESHRPVSDTFVEVLVELRRHLEEREALVGQLLSITHQALRELARCQDPVASGATPGPAADPPPPTRSP